MPSFIKKSKAGWTIESTRFIFNPESYGDIFYSSDSERFSIEKNGSIEICWKDPSPQTWGDEDTMRLDKLDHLGVWPRWHEGDTVREAIDRVGGEWL